MRTLIDGYNVMHAAGLMGGKLGPAAFRKARLRFLNRLAASLEPVEAHLTTVVFDAKAAPDHVPATTRHKGITVVYAVEADSADERIEDLIAHHDRPKALTVVSSDHRIQKAASRKKAKYLSADDFLDQLETLSQRRRPTAAISAGLEREITLSDEESAFWIEEFREVVDSDEAREVSRGDPSFPTDEELAAIAREVEEEFRC